MRGLFSTGIVDVLLEEGITVDGMVGVSAGAYRTWFDFFVKDRKTLSKAHGFGGVLF